MPVQVYDQAALKSCGRNYPLGGRIKLRENISELRLEVTNKLKKHTLVQDETIFSTTYAFVSREFA